MHLRRLGDEVAAGGAAQVVGLLEPVLDLPETFLNALQVEEARPIRALLCTVRVSPAQG